MRDGAPVDPNLSLADMLPPDKSDSSGILQAGYALVEALARRAPTASPLEATVTLGPAAWAALEAETRRPYRGHATYKYTPHPGGAGAVRWERAGPIREELDALRARVDRIIGQLTEQLGRLRIGAKWDGESVTLHPFASGSVAAETERDP